MDLRCQVCKKGQVKELLQSIVQVGDDAELALGMDWRDLSTLQESRVRDYRWLLQYEENGVGKGNLNSGSLYQEAPVEEFCKPG